MVASASSSYIGSTSGHHDDPVSTDDDLDEHMSLGSRSSSSKSSSSGGSNGASGGSGANGMYTISGDHVTQMQRSGAEALDAVLEMTKQASTYTSPLLFVI